MIIKRCNKCNEYKPLNEFTKRNDSLDGLRNQCKDCSRKKSKQYFKNHPEYNKQYYKNNKDFEHKRVSNWHKNNKLKSKIIYYKKRAKRKGWGKPKPINNWFEGSELHHLHIDNHQDCVYIPEDLHKSIYHENDNLKSMKEINNIIFEWLCIQEQL